MNYSNLKTISVPKIKCMKYYTIETINKIVSSVTMVGDLRDISTDRHVVDARKIFSKIGLKYYSSTRIGEYLNKDHTTILYYQREANNLIDTDSVFRGFYETCVLVLGDVDSSIELEKQYRYHINEADKILNKLKEMANERI